MRCQGRCLKSNLVVRNAFEVFWMYRLGNLVDIEHPGLVVIDILLCTIGGNENKHEFYDEGEAF